MIFGIRSLLTFFVGVSVLFELAALPKSMPISSYLKSKYLGATIEYTKLPKESSGLFSFFSKSDDEEVESKTGIAKQIIIGQDSYYFLLDNGDKVEILFKGSLSDYGVNQKVKKTETSLQMEVLRNQEYLNRSMASIGDNPGFSSDMSSLMGSLDSLQDIIANDTDTSEGEDIVYIDLKTGHKVKGIAKASLNGVFLVGGSEVKLQFVSDEE